MPDQWCVWYGTEDESIECFEKVFISHDLEDAKKFYRELKEKLKSSYAGYVEAAYACEKGILGPSPVLYIHKRHELLYKIWCRTVHSEETRKIKIPDWVGVPPEMGVADFWCNRYYTSEEREKLIVDMEERQKEMDKYWSEKGSKDLTYIPRVVCYPVPIYLRDTDDTVLDEYEYLCDTVSSESDDEAKEDKKRKKPDL